MGKAGWPMPLRRDWVKNPGRPTNELQARTNEDKGEDGQEWVMGKYGL